MSSATVQGAEERARLRSDVAIAWRILARTWPLATFIAVNPLGGLEERTFEGAIATSASVLGARGTLDETVFRAAHARGRISEQDLLGALRRLCPRALDSAPRQLGGRTLSAAELLLADLLHGTPAPPPAHRARTLAERIAPAVAASVDAQTAKWCAAFCDAGQAGWPMPGRARGLYGAWRDLAARDRSLGGAVRERLRALPERPEDAALEALAQLGVTAAQRRAYLQAHLACLPGWAAHARWRAEHDRDLDLVDYLALRLVYEAALLAEEATRDPRAHTPAESGPPPALPEAGERARRLGAVLAAGPAPRPADLDAVGRLLERMPVALRALIWLEAYESHYRDALLSRLTRPAEMPFAGRAEVQFVCCIDARSEGLRRHLESHSQYETLGFAGFFGVAIRFQDLAGGTPSDLCPVLLEPRNEIRERPLVGTEALATRALAGRRVLHGAEQAFHAAKHDLAAGFALAEAAGWLAGPLAATKTILAGPFGAMRERLQRRAVPQTPSVLTPEQGFTFEERALFAEVALRMMGLTAGFAGLVVFCAHGSQTENNPYQAALDCGACGGQRGAPNARTAAAILNAGDVRSHLAARGIEIPSDTWFVAAEHDTASDRVTLLDRHLVPSGHIDALDRLAAELLEAGAQLSAERCQSLPGAPRQATPATAARHVRARSSDWAQVFPEWGLAGNAAFVIAPRSLTRGLDLERRVFLHSYEAAVDPDGAALETILTAPLVVAQWINCQYYFSTVDPAVFGAGSKTIHNVVGGIGVLAGHNGDLQPGLPWQSVSDGYQLVHEPMRLLAIVEAPLARIDAIIARNTVLQHLFGNAWVALAARAQRADPWQRHTADGWQPWPTLEETQ